jgi:CrcB protein
LSYLWIALGGALGSVARFWFSGLVAHRWGESFPWGTILVNISGCFVIGLFSTLTGPGGRWFLPPSLRFEFFMVGVCGGYTTFSSFSIQTLSLAQRGQWLWAAGNVFMSVMCCLVAVWLGHLCATAINK